MDFTPVDRTDLSTYDAYLSSLSAPIDSYLEGAILESTFHRISDNDADVGFFAIHDGTLLTQFHLVGPSRRAGQATMARILDEHAPTAAYVSTCDNFLLSHIMDREVVLNRQGYFFVEGVSGPVEAETKLVYRIATPADIDAIVDVSGDFLSPVDVHVAAGEVHVGWDGDDLVAVGIAEAGRLLLDYNSIGMFTHEGHRQRGIGTSTLRYLRNVCHEQGKIPIAGCWYYNANSKLTLEAAGMVTVTRLLRFEFKTV